MSKGPRVSGREVVAALTRVGFRVRRQHGSHIIMRRDQPFAQTVVPNHPEIEVTNTAPFMFTFGMVVVKPCLR